MCRELADDRRRGFLSDHRNPVHKITHFQTHSLLPADFNSYSKMMFLIFTFLHQSGPKAVRQDHKDAEYQFPHIKHTSPNTQQQQVTEIDGSASAIGNMMMDD